MIFGIARDDAVARQRPVVFLANSDDLARIARAKIVQRVVTGYTGDAGDQKRQWKRFVGAGNHTAIVVPFATGAE